MSITGIETAWQSPGMQNRSNFGAAVVEKTMDNLNNASGSSFAPVDKQTFGAAVVNKTFEYMNNGPGGAKGGFGDMSQTYDFAKNVLGAYATGKGTIADITT
jgi:hypothetical protein